MERPIVTMMSVRIAGSVAAVAFTWKRDSRYAIVSAYLSAAPL